MRKLMVAVTLMVAGAAAQSWAPVAHAAPPTLQPDQLVLCAGISPQPLNVTVENLTYDSTGPIQFALKGCQTIVDGSAADNPNGTPISASYRVAFQPDSKNPNDKITVLTNSGQTRTVQGDDTTVQISSLEGVQVTFTP